MSSPEQGFARMLEAARRGAEWAWEEIYRDLAPAVLAYMRARGAPDPEDLAGEVFVQAVRDIGRFEGGPRELRSWVLAIAHNRLIDEGRRRERRPADPVPPETIALRGPVRDAEQEALDRLGEDEVRRLISGLSANQQAVILLRVLGGLTIPEVARVLGKREGAVKALQRRGLARIGRQLRRAGGAGGA
jgi:RNA polymerase sigma factor (sigma-70 family)